MKGVRRARETRKIVLNAPKDVPAHQLVIVTLDKISTTVRRIPVNSVTNPALNALTVGAMTV